MKFIIYVIIFLLFNSYKAKTIDTNSNNIVNQINNHIKFIEEFCSKNKNLFKLKFSYTNVVLESSVIFDNISINECINKMKKINDIKPLIFLWEKLKHQKQENLIFIREMATLILIIYKNILLKIFPQFSEDISIKEIVDLYEKSLNLPILEILKTLKNLQTKIIELNKLFNNDNSLPIKVWLKKYWYIPLTVFTGILTIIINYIKSINYPIAQSFSNFFYKKRVEVKSI